MNANVALDVDTRVAVFFDVQNLYFSTKKIRGESLRVNYPKLLEYVVFGRNCIHTSAFMMLAAKKDAGPFKSMLVHAGIDVKIKIMDFRERGGARFNAANWEIGLTIELIKWAPKVETLILVSGNGTYLDVLQYLRTAFPVRVEVCGFAESTSHNLMEEADDFINLSSAKIPPDLFITCKGAEIDEPAKEEEDSSKK